MKDLIRYGL